MPRREALTRKASIEALHQYGDTPAVVLANFHILVHDRSTTSGSCPCCGGDTCKIVDDIPDFQLLIDTRGEGGRYLRSTFPGSRSLRRHRQGRARRRCAAAL